MSSICHFDIPAKDFEKMKNFYNSVFGWKFEKQRDSEEFWSIDFAPRTHEDIITGAMVVRSAPEQPIGCYFDVASIDDTSKKINEHGGMVFVPKTQMTGKGFYACCLDPENNYFVIWEKNENTESAI